MKYYSKYSTIGLASLFLVVSFSLSGCANRLVFAERSGFNLGISINDDPATPVRVNTGLDRVIVGMVPPRRETTDQQGQATADDEAVSLFSGFRIKYKDTPGQIGGELNIRTQFASGVAAIKLAKNPKAVNELVDVKNIKILPGEPDLASKSLDELLGFDGEKYDQGKIEVMKRDCWPNAGVSNNTLFIDFMQAPEFADKREKVRNCMKSKP